MMKREEKFRLITEATKYNLAIAHLKDSIASRDVAFLKDKLNKLDFLTTFYMDYVKPIETKYGISFEKDDVTNILNNELFKKDKF
jgi:hypothetical protein